MRLNSVVMSESGLTISLTDDQREQLLRRGLVTVSDGEESEAHVLNVAPGHTWEEIVNTLQGQE